MTRYSFLVFSLGPCLFLLLLLAACDEPKVLQVTVGEQQVRAIFWQPARDLSPALLLVPGVGETLEGWGPLADQLAVAGYGVLVLEPREQGRLGPEHLLADVRAGFAFLREQQKIDAARIGFAGARLGADAVLHAAAEDPLVQVVVLFSPGFRMQGFLVEPTLREYGHRPMLLLAAEGDVEASEAVRRAAELAPGETLLKLYPGQARGTELLTEETTALKDVLGFLRSHL